MGPALFTAMAAGALLALPSSAHCAVMCGPLAVHARGARAGGYYFAGRLVSYGLVGSLAGTFASSLSELTGGVWVETLVAWSLALTLLISALGMFRRTTRPTLVTLKTRGRARWSSRIFAHLFDEPLLLGAFTALLPCGALATAALAAGATQSAFSGAALMLTFASITGLSLLGVGLVSARLSTSTLGRRLLSAALIVGAALLLWRPLPAWDGEPSCHGAPTSGGH